MRILLLPLGSFGDVNPFIGLGAALKKRGHEVILLAHDPFESMVQQAGLGFASCGPADFSLENGQSPGAAFSRFCLASIPVTFYRIQQLYLPDKTILAAEPHAFAGRIAQEALGIPLATVTPVTTEIPSAYRPESRAALRSWLGRWKRRVRFRLVGLNFDRVIRSEINSFRATLGLKPVRRVWGSWRNSPLRVIGLWPDWFYSPQPDWPPNSVATGFIECDVPAATDSPESLERLMEREFDKERPVVINGSTALLDTREFLTAAIGACQNLRRPAILLTRHKAMLPDPLPPGIFHFPYLPLGDLLPRAAAIIHNGGIGTIARGLRAGIPQLVMPIAFDQFINARRVTQLGVARSLARKPLTAENVSAQLSELLQSPTVNECCQAYAAKFHDNDALEKSCDYIEAVG